MDWINIFKKVLEFLRTPPLMKLDHRLNLQGRLTNSNLIQIAALALVTILSISVRIPGLGVPLFGDEATTFWEHRSSSWKEFFFIMNLTNKYIKPFSMFRGELTLLF